MSGNDIKLPAGTRIGEYEVLSEVGRGASAVIYRVAHRPTGEEYAAKVLRPSVASMSYVRDKFLSEVQILSQLDHPNIVNVIGSHQDESITACFMELIEGSTLEEYLPLHPGGLSEVLTLSIGQQVADAMTYAHRHDIVHRDLKPSNILLRQQPSGDLHAVVADFGLAKALGKESKTRTGLRVGTIAYMAPEQIRDSSRVDARADVYAIGITLYECLTGTLPYPYNSMYEVMQAQLQDNMPQVRNQRIDVSVEWDQIIAKACQKEREQRSTSADVLVALHQLANQLGLVDRTTIAIAPISPEQNPKSTMLGPGPQVWAGGAPRVTQAMAAAGNPFASKNQVEFLESMPQSPTATDTGRPNAPDQAENIAPEAQRPPAVEEDIDLTVRSVDVDAIHVLVDSDDTSAADPVVQTSQRKLAALAGMNAPELQAGFDDTADIDLDTLAKMRARQSDGGDFQGAATDKMTAIPGLSNPATTLQGDLDPPEPQSHPVMPPREPQEQAVVTRASSPAERRAEALEMVSGDGPGRALTIVVIVIIVLGLAGVVAGLYFAAR